MTVYYHYSEVHVIVYAKHNVSGPVDVPQITLPNGNPVINAGPPPPPPHLPLPKNIQGYYDASHFTPNAGYGHDPDAEGTESYFQINSTGVYFMGGSPAVHYPNKNITWNPYKPGSFYVTNKAGE